VNCCPPSRVDHQLISRVQARTDGASVHDVQVLLGNYFALCTLADSDPAAAACVDRLEAKLRAFCQTGILARRLPCEEAARAAVH
jgi:hypothetical protein